MRAPLTFSIQAWSAWGALQEEEAPLSTPVTLRRRLSPLSQRVMHAAWTIMPQGTARIVFASRHGEFGRTLSLFKSLAQHNEVSPADFTLSVHHALTGLLSIAQGNRGGHIAIAAGEESFGNGFLEALACLKENPSQPVLFLYCDEPLPAPYDGFDLKQEEPIALALLLTAPTEGAAFTFKVEPVAGPGAESSHAVAFWQFLEGNEESCVRVGPRMQWRWSRAEHG